MKIWIDTDIGGDIDDALTVLLAMASREIDLIGVSTVFENTSARAKIAAYLLQSGQFDTPVYAGIGLPRKAKTIFGAPVDVNGLPKTYFRNKFDNVVYDRMSASEALAQAVSDNENEITVIALGALTNLADFIENHFEEAKKIKQIYIMGGAEKLNVNEFNFSCDPEAADIVLSSPIKKNIVTLDVTFQCKLSGSQLLKLTECKSETVKTVMEMRKVWGTDVYLHDPLTLASVLKEDFVTYCNGYLKVELDGEFSRGKCVNLTDFNWARQGREDMKISQSVKKDEFLEFYIDSICNLDRFLLNKQK